MAESSSTTAVPTRWVPHVPPAGAPASPPTGPVRPRPGLVLAAACVCQLLVVLDISVVNVALPSIGDALGFASSSLSWVINAYTLTFGGLLLLGGRLADLIGHRRTMLAALALFGTVSLLGGLATGPGQLIAARAAQGVAAAVLSPVSLTVLMVAFPDAHGRRRALAAWGVVATGGGALGVLLSGVLTQYLSWRWVLFINVPIVLAAAGLALTAIRGHGARAHAQLDVLGALLATATTTLLVYGCVHASESTWSDPVTLAVFLLAALCGAGFVLRETRAATPLVRLSVLRVRRVWLAVVVLAFIGAAMISGFYFGSLSLQQVLGYDPVITGLAFLPFFACMAIATSAGPRLLERYGTRLVLTAGLVVAAAGMAAFGRLGPGSGYLTFLIATVPASIGLGLSLAPTLTMGTAGVERDDAGMVSGLLNTSRQVGGSLALAALATVVAAVAGPNAGGVEAATGYRAAFVLTGALLFTAALIVLTCVPRRAPDRQQAGER
ncbi:MFS transporter [Pseudactinotalea sp. HY160]|uniref:MFS transporter n=1 Tax=Pseudactinotalea sp. HY160 TaxID=2654490 RepID=UPI00128CBD80|nr:MFS transporter [Pseudactinotalea sp. HY160]MPV51253.1 MFS transporter [Pseudactinotalea sp. HY160]